MEQADCERDTMGNCGWPKAAKIGGDECRISPKQVDRAIDILESKGFVERKIYKFNGAPMIHLRLLREAVLAAWIHLYCPKVKMDIPKR